jgi:hypothetical protein
VDEPPDSLYSWEGLRNDVYGFMADHPTVWRSLVMRLNSFFAVYVYYYDDCHYYYNYYTFAITITTTTTNVTVAVVAVGTITTATASSSNTITTSNTLLSLPTVAPQNWWSQHELSRSEQSMHKQKRCDLLVLSRSVSYGMQ